MLPNYQIWVCNDDYSRHVSLSNTPLSRTWTRLRYRQAVNDLEACTLDLVPNSPKIADISLMKRLLIYRDGVIVFGGLLERESWKIGPRASDDTYTLSARSAAEYATWRIAVPPPGDSHDTQKGALDDVAKAYVRNHMGTLADVARQFGDLTVAANAGAAPSGTWQARYTILLTVLQNLAAGGGFDWRFVPSATGWTFETRHPHWGVDRRKGNGVNDECVFSLDRRNFVRMTYTRDLLEHYNAVYAAGNEQGINRKIELREDAAAAVAFKRREMFFGDSRLSKEESIQAAGDVQLAKYAVAEVMTVKPLPGVWPAQFDLGDLITCYAVRYGRTFRYSGKVTALNVEVDERGVETVAPELEAV